MFSKRFSTFQRFTVKNPFLSFLLLSVWFCLTLNTPAQTPTVKAPVDFNGDGKTDFAVVGARRPINFLNPFQLEWYIQPNTYPNPFPSDANATNYQVDFGLINPTTTSESDIPVPEDFDGDGKSDIAVWRLRNGVCSGNPNPSPNQACFYVLQSSNNTFRSQAWGTPGDNPRISGDYDGDGKADFAVYRRPEASTAGQPCGANSSTGGIARGGFYYFASGSPTQPFKYQCFGLAGDVPFKGDFNGDKRLDFVVQRDIGGSAYYLANFSSSPTPRYDAYFQFGFPNDLAVLGDFDGDGKTDIDVLRPTGTSSTDNYAHYILSTGTGNLLAYNLRYGYVGDIPAPGDYNGDGKTDLAFYRQSNGTFYVQFGLNPTAANAQFRFGTSSDLPVATYNVFNRAVPFP